MNTHANQQIPRILSIAGTDPTGGAGIHADLKSIAANGGYGMAALTALVAQNTMGVRSIHTPPASFLTEQLLAVSDDVTIDAVKIGMLFTTPIISAVADWLTEVRPPAVVLDPVMVATSGDALLSDSATEALRDLLPAAELVTPNIPERGALLGQPAATTWEDALAQAKTLAATYGTQILAKGGHLSGEESAEALVSPDGEVKVFASPRIATVNTHGTGCSLSSAVATRYARTRSWATAIRQAKEWLTDSIAGAQRLNVGHGNGPISHFATLWRCANT